MEDHVTVKQAAECLGVSKYQVYRRILRGNIPAHLVLDRHPPRWLIRQADLDEYIAAGGAEVLTPPRKIHEDEDGTLGAPEVAMITGYSAETIRRMCNEGKLTHTRGPGPKGRFRIPRDAVEKMLS
jgi:excisionase family DNA binding protein